MIDLLHPLAAWCARAWCCARAAVGYLTDRLDEKSTWGGIGTALLGAKELVGPLCWLFVLCGVIMVLVPGKKG